MKKITILIFSTFLCITAYAQYIFIRLSDERRYLRVYKYCMCGDDKLGNNKTTYSISEKDSTILILSKIENGIELTKRYKIDYAPKKFRLRQISFAKEKKEVIKFEEYYFALLLPTVAENTNWRRCSALADHL